MRINVVKIGGNVIDHEDGLRKFLSDFSKIEGYKILVHGGGKIATKLAEQLNIPTEMVNGRRVTSKDMLDLATMVYGGLINKKIVAQLQSLGVNALGLSGADGGCILARKREGSDVDYGFVGDITKVNEEFIKTLLQHNLIPIIAPLSHDGQGQLLNTNADSITNAIAKSLVPFAEVNLFFCFEKKGLLENIDDPNSVIPLLKPETYAELRKQNKIFDGMIPKLDNAFEAISEGVKRVIICNSEDILAATQLNNTGTIIQN